MTAFAIDDFNRADNASLGPNWTVRQGSPNYQILSNAAVPTSYTAADLCTWYSPIMYSTDHYSQCTISGLSGTTNQAGLGVACRIRTDNFGGGSTFLDFYTAVVNAAATNNVSVAKEVAGTYTLLGQRTQAWTDGDTLRLEVQGNTLRVYRNGVQLGADITDSSFVSGVYPVAPGLMLFTAMTAGSIDNWEGADFLPVGPTVFRSSFPSAKFGPF